MNIDKILERLKKAAELLKDRNTYYAIVLVLMGYWVYQKDVAIVETKNECDSTANRLRTQREMLQAKLDNKDCAGEVLAYKNLLDQLQTSTASQKQEEKEALELERLRTEKLNKTYELLKK